MFSVRLAPIDMIFGYATGMYSVFSLAEKTFQQIFPWRKILKESDVIHHLYCSNS